jgi:hypothetical protein
MKQPPIVVTVVGDAEAETVDYLICAPADTPTPFADVGITDVGNCCRCGMCVQYRWHAPRKPKRLCIECFRKSKELGLT